MILQIGLQGTFQNMGSFLLGIGFFDVILPFILVFTIVYASTKIIPIFKEDKRLRIVIAFVLSFLFIYPSIIGAPADQDPVKIIQKTIPELSVIAIAIVMTLILIGVFGKELGRGWVSAIAFLSLIAVVYSFGIASGIIGSWPIFSFLSDPDLHALLIIILVFGLIVMFITSDETGEGIGPKIKKILDSFTQ